MTGSPVAPTPFYAAVSTIPDVHLRPVNFGRELNDLSSFRRVGQVLRSLPAIFSFGALALFVMRERIPIIHTVSRPRDALACVLLARITRSKCLIHMQLGYGDWMSPMLRWSLRHADGLVIDAVVRALFEGAKLPDGRPGLANRLEEIALPVRRRGTYKLRLQEMPE